MVQVYLGLGSNIARYRHLSAGLDCLAEMADTLQVSEVYESAAVGFVGEPFLNLVVGLDTALTPAALLARLRAIEDAHGRVRNVPKYSARTLDIDILTYGDLCGEFEGLCLPRDEIDHHAFVLQPLAELAPDGRHPRTGRAYAELWRDFRTQGEGEPAGLLRVDFCWRGRWISRTREFGQCSGDQR